MLALLSCSLSSESITALCFTNIQFPGLSEYFLKYTHSPRKKGNEITWSLGIYLPSQRHNEVRRLILYFPAGETKAQTVACLTTISWRGVPMPGPVLWIFLVFSSMDLPCFFEHIVVLFCFVLTCSFLNMIFWVPPENEYFFLRCLLGIFQVFVYTPT